MAFLQSLQEMAVTVTTSNRGVLTFLRPGPFLSLYRLAGRQVTN